MAWAKAQRSVYRIDLSVTNQVQMVIYGSMNPFRLRRIEYQPGEEWLCDGHKPGMMPLSFSVTAANGDERIEARENSKKIRICHGKRGRSRCQPDKIAGDKGFDSRDLREYFRKKGIKPEIPK